MALNQELQLFADATAPARTRRALTPAGPGGLRTAQR